METDPFVSRFHPVSPVIYYLVTADGTRTMEGQEYE